MQTPDHPYQEENPYKDLHIYYMQGCLDPNVSIEDESFIGNWEEDGFTFLFFTAPADRTVEKASALQPGIKLLDRYQMSYEQWHGDAISTLCVDNFIISPPWLKIKNAGPDEFHRIILDPGVVFGTGTHPTTRDCLVALQQAFEEQVPDRCIDIGTGTGILAMAAASLGCGKVIAVDLNLLSVKTALRNIRLNRMEDRILAIRGSARNFIDMPSDFIISNIHFDVMKRLLDCDGFYTRKRFILSGLMKSEAAAIKDCLFRKHAEITRVWDQNGIWFTFLGKTG